ncbi:MAG: hypothetical protein O7E52_08790 [Candidatus Poribacteria bacterium]|nr:hypothetical protein [Candidatus Poribacteria bacterium]
MATTARAIETTGIIDDSRLLRLDNPVPVDIATRVRVIILVPQENDEEFDETEWLKAASTNPVFDLLKDAEEDIYTLNDGKPFHDEG